MRSVWQWEEEAKVKKCEESLTTENGKLCSVDNIYRIIHSFWIAWYYIKEVNEKVEMDNRGEVLLLWSFFSLKWKEIFVVDYWQQKRS